MKATKILSLSLVALCLMGASFTIAQDPPKKRKRVIVAVVDTGASSDIMNSNIVCPTGSEDFTGMGFQDHHGHGTHIIGLIDQNVKAKFLSKYVSKQDIILTEANYCIVVLKFYDPLQKKGDTLAQEISAINKAIDLKVDIINVSAGGTEYDAREHEVVLKALDRGIKLIFAAGNEASNIDEKPYYPASHDKRIYVVGNVSRNHSRLPSSNFGSNVRYWEMGDNVLSYLPGGIGSMTGTSQSCAVKTGKIVRRMLSN